MQIPIGMNLYNNSGKRAPPPADILNAHPIMVKNVIIAPAIILLCEWFRQIAAKKIK